MGKGDATRYTDVERDRAGGLIAPPVYTLVVLR